MTSFQSCGGRSGRMEVAKTARNFWTMRETDSACVRRVGVVYAGEFNQEGR